MAVGRMIVLCGRCKKVVDGVRAENYDNGFYDLTNEKWEKYKKNDELFLHIQCMEKAMRDE